MSVFARPGRLAAAVLSCGCVASLPLVSAPAHAASVTTTATAMNGSGDIADDPCIWINSSNRSRSIVIGVNKSRNGRDGGLYAFDLDGSRARNNFVWREGINWFEPGERYNNVDLRYRFPAGNQVWDIVVASNRSDRELDVYRVKRNGSGNFNGLELVGEVPLGGGFASGTDAPYGLALYHSRAKDKYFAFTSDKEGRVAQYELRWNPNGSGQNQITGTRVRAPFVVSTDGSEVEGIVADDRRDVIYIASEDRGIYRYPTDNQGRVIINTRVTVATPNTAGGLSPDFEGLTLYNRGGNGGYLLASIQGDSKYAVFERNYSGNNANRFLKTFRIGGVQKTDGLDVTNVNLGGNYTSGMLVVHDGEGNSPTRYKFVKWSDVADDPGPRLAVDTGFNPRPPNPR